MIINAKYCYKDELFLSEFSHFFLNLIILKSFFGLRLLNRNKMCYTYFFRKKILNRLDSLLTKNLQIPIDFWLCMNYFKEVSNFYGKTSG